MQFCKFCSRASGSEPPPTPSRRALGASDGRHSGGEQLKANSGNDYREVVTRKLAVPNPFAKAKKFVLNAVARHSRSRKSGILLKLSAKGADVKLIEMKKIIVILVAFGFGANAQEIVVDLSRQYLTAYNSDGTVFLECNCVTGSDNSTPTGTWYINYKDVNYVSGEFGVPMQYAMKFGSRGQAIHVTSAAGARSYLDWFISQSGTRHLAGTHGCIGVRENCAQTLFNWVIVNKTKVTVVD